MAGTKIAETEGTLRAAALKELHTIKGFRPGDKIPTSDQFMREREALWERAYPRAVKPSAKGRVSNRVEGI